MVCFSSHGESQSVQKSPTKQNPSSFGELFSRSATVRNADGLLIWMMIKKTLDTVDDCVAI